ncbi:DUF4136 domain-containing protein [uncultured Psychroserpens sp.]|uniref:DUF4136 domain-containing protein n=1 Tax=uncultured Psychroserpens sp. TaxID=255436 RepID=UPI00261088E6|nr:DUF4136 domain-containing protein [uncultured Psychroserpens sp.]
MKHLPKLLILLLIMSCAPVHVSYDYEKSTNFENYKTYNYYTDLNTGLSELDTKRLVDVLNQAMQSRGYSLSETPNFIIDIKSSEFQEQPNNNVAVGLGGTGRNVGGGISIGLPIGQSQMQREIVFDFIDDSSVGLFWQAIAVADYRENWSPEKREAHFKTVVDKVLEGFPPETK